MCLLKPVITRPFIVKRSVYPALAAALLLVSTTVPEAKDLGVHGRVYDIIEIDMRALLVASANRADVDHLQQELRSSAERYLDNLPRRETGRVQRTQTRWLDPSFVLDEDIAAPMQNANGEWEWGVLHRKGTRFNPLTVQRPHNAMLFFDGNDAEQWIFVSKMVEAYPGKVMPVEATGANPERLALELEVPVFSATDQMRARFEIRATPSLLYAGEGPHTLELGMTEFAAPYSLEEAERAWPLLRTPFSGGSQ